MNSELEDFVRDFVVLILLPHLIMLQRRVVQGHRKMAVLCAQQLKGLSVCTPPIPECFCQMHSRETWYTFPLYLLLAQDENIRSIDQLHDSHHTHSCASQGELMRALCEDACSFSQSLLLHLVQSVPRCGEERFTFVSISCRVMMTPKIVRGYFPPQPGNQIGQHYMVPNAEGWTVRPFENYVCLPQVQIPHALVCIMYTSTLGWIIDLTPTQFLPPGNGIETPCPFVYVGTYASQQTQRIYEVEYHGRLLTYEITTQAKQRTETQLLDILHSCYVDGHPEKDNFVRRTTQQLREAQEIMQQLRTKYNV